MLSDNLRHQLLSRRSKLESILQNLDVQKSQLFERVFVEDRWKGPSRQDLLDSLDDWYHRELLEIDRALARTEENGYGRCLGCNMSIDPDWLEHFPEAEYCRSCDNLKKWMALG